MDFDCALPAIPSGKPVPLQDPVLVINGKDLAELTETVMANVTVELRSNGESVCVRRSQMRVLAYDQWQGGETYRDLLPAFVLPNHPAIPALMHDAAERLSQWGKPGSLEGYQSNDPNRVRDLAAAAYAAMQKKSIVYAEAPASFSVAGQRIRTPETVLDQRLGTCMDLTLLYAAGLEAMGLHPLLVMMQGHIFAGVWLKKRTAEELKSGNVVIDNIDELIKRVDNGSDELTFVECTAMCAGKQMSFEEAENAAKWGNLTKHDQFLMAIDVHLARCYGVRPIPSRVKDSGEYRILAEDAQESEITAAPKNLHISIAQAPASTAGKITGKKDLWESKLLDLSQRNMLLNLPHNASVMPIMSSHIDELEDALADGHEFHMLPVAKWIADLMFTQQNPDGTNAKSVKWLPEAIKQVGLLELTSWPVNDELDFNEKFRQEFRNHRLYTYCSEKELDRQLTGIYRAARASQQENGVSSLYLAIGLMRWIADPDSQAPSYAPLILLPIEIIRKSANQGYGLHARDEEPHFNTTLLEMLRQNYNLEISGLDPLPTDDHGIDIKKTFAMVRSALYPLKGWDVVESCVIGNFSFAQFAMWNDLHTAGDMLNRSKVVRSLMKGHVDWSVAAAKQLDDEETYLPIAVDATQLQAIKMAAHGTTFVLHGPPGTGKSQTITGMIANLLARGKTVLFVAEKMAALSVVQRRLSSLGIGDFCLELHSDKANKKQVLTQLDRALAVKHPTSKTKYVEQLRAAQASRAKLDGYARHLHAVHPSGYSLRDLIDLYESVRDANDAIHFDMGEAGRLTREQIAAHVPLIRQLTVEREAVGSVEGHPLTGVRLTSYSADVRAALPDVCANYRDALRAMRASANSAASLLNMNRPQRRSDYARLEQAVRLYDDCIKAKPATFDLLEGNRAELDAYFAAVNDLQKEEARLLTLWKKEFLAERMPPYLARHQAAARKFIGKGGAMAAVVSQVQAFALQPITFESIPGRLQEIESYQTRRQAVQSARNALPDGTKAAIRSLNSAEDYRAAIWAAREYRSLAEAFPGGFAAVQKLSGSREGADLLSAFHTSYVNALRAETQLNNLLVRSDNVDAHDWVDSELSLCSDLMERQDMLKNWVLYNQARQECVKVGLQPVVEACEGGVEAQDLIPAYQKGLYHALINQIMLSDDVLSSFSGVTFNEAIRQFRQMDDALLQNTRSEIRYLLASRVPDAWGSPAVGMELNLLRKAIGSNARGMSIRTLFDRIPHIVPALCPCMLMSPNSVAQYLAQRNDLFDVVIFDEASQLPTCKAIGALARARDAVIVGDPKQMPPTAFFAGSGPNVDDLALDDLDSILDDALALGIPSQHLQWHYRSTHESLIAFSNHQFYDNRMFTFPSANDRERHVTAVHVDGLYNGGLNAKEAEAVVAEIVRRFRDPALKGQSIGVVTFNVKQQALIEDLLARQFQNDPALDAWANDGDDPLFVKNLENVQGDERDVILFSIGYGPDEKGRISMNFGPINKAGGEKRLNVAFSRARVTMTIFSSMYSTDLKVTASSPDGLVAFRDFLKYAEGSELHSESEGERTTPTGAWGGILQSICAAVEAQGYQCVPMVGHSDFHVDVAVVDPCEPTQYLLGILLDGDGYRQAGNTRDREVAQISVLNNLGWTIHRIWTIDWWDNRAKELARLMALLQEQRQQSQARHEAQAEAQQKAAHEQAQRDEEAMALQAQLERQAALVMQEAQEAATPEEEAPAAEDSQDADSSAAPQERIPADTGRDPVQDLFDRLKQAGAQVVDKRSSGGALWVIGGKDLQAIMQEFQKLGVQFAFKAGGGKATGGQDGWWTRTDISVLSTSHEQGAAPAPIVPVQYECADLPNDKLSLADYADASRMPLIESRALAIAQVEAPILKDALIRKIMASFGVGKSAAALEATEKAIKAAKIKSTRQKGIIFCWAPDQDPKDYRGLRVSNERSCDEICPQELRNAVVYALQVKGELNKDDLIKEASTALGYKRLGKNLEAALTLGVQAARSSGAIVYVPGGTFRLA